MLKVAHAAFILALTTTGFSAQAAELASTGCSSAIKAEASGQYMTSAYDVPARVIERDQNQAIAVARQRAIAAWRSKVAALCPGRFTNWYQAHEKSAEVCDQAMGGRFTYCVSAEPARKRWHFG